MQDMQMVESVVKSRAKKGKNFLCWEESFPTSFLSVVKMYITVKCKVIQKQS